MALDEAVIDDLLDYNPIQSVKKKNRPTQKTIKREYLTEDELKKFANAEFKNDLLKRAFIIGCLTGLRHVDIRQMTWKNVGVIINGIESICLYQQKTSEEIVIPLNDSIKRWLQIGRAHV